jgi:hypothetical protein
MSATIKAVFEKHCGHLKFDKTLAKRWTQEFVADCACAFGNNGKLRRTA